MDDENKPAALIEVVAGQQAIGNWTVSTWLTKRPWTTVLQEQFGAASGRSDGRAAKIQLGRPHL